MIELETWNSHGQRPPALSHPITKRDENNALETIFPKKLPFKQSWRKFKRKYQDKFEMSDILNKFKTHG